MRVVLFGVHSHTVLQAIITYQVSPARGGGGESVAEAIAALIPTVTPTFLCYAIILEMFPINLRFK